MARECVSNRAPVAWLETDHGSNVNIAEPMAKLHYHGTVFGRPESSSRASFGIRYPSALSR